MSINPFKEMGEVKMDAMTSESPKRKKTTKNEVRKEIIERIEKHKDYVEELQTYYDQLEKLRFEVGQVAVHKDYGAVVIRDFSFSDLDWVSYGVDRVVRKASNKPPKDEITYLVATWEGDVAVVDSELLEYNENTRELYCD